MRLQPRFSVWTGCEKRRTYEESSDSADTVMERSRREKKSKVDVAALNALSNAKRGVVNRKDQHVVCSLAVLSCPCAARARE